MEPGLIPTEAGYPGKLKKTLFESEFCHQCIEQVVTSTNKHLAARLMNEEMDMPWISEGGSEQVERISSCVFNLDWIRTAKMFVWCSSWLIFEVAVTVVTIGHCEQLWNTFWITTYMLYVRTPSSTLPYRARKVKVRYDISNGLGLTRFPI